MNPQDQKAKSRGFSQDMSPEAIEARINRVSQLRKLTSELRKAKFLGPVENAGQTDSPDHAKR